MFPFPLDATQQRTSVREKMVDISSDLQMMTGNNVSLLNETLDNDNNADDSVECCETFDCNDLYREYRNECEKWLNIENIEAELDQKVIIKIYFYR